MATLELVAVDRRGRYALMPDEDERESDLKIARRLLACGYVTSAEYDCWYAHYCGRTIWSLRGRSWADRGPVHASTLYLWCQRVNQAIRDARMIELPPDEEPVRFGVTVASGSDTRRAGDPTAAGRKPTEESSWDVERLRIAGNIDRWSRKR